MIDRIGAMARLTLSRPVVCVEQPDWIVELLLTLCVLLLIAWAVTFAQLAPMAAELSAVRLDARHWKTRATTPEAFIGVRIEPDGVGFRCQHFGVRREWERVVAAECQTLGALLHMARAAP
jgi:hypothetical protein